MLKKLLIIAAIVVSGAYANAQTFIFGNSSGNLGFSGSGVGINANFGIGEWTLLGPIGGRVEVGVGVNSGTFSLGFTADALFSIQRPKANNIGIYAGAGVGLEIVPSTIFDLRGVIGIEYFLGPQYSLMAEFIPALYFGNSVLFAGQIRAGLAIYP